MLYDVPIDVLVQRDNFNKERLTTVKQLDMYDEQIKQLRAELLKGDPEAQKIWTEYLDKIQGLTDTIREITEKSETE